MRNENTSQGNSNNKMDDDVQSQKSSKSQVHTNLKLLHSRTRRQSSFRSARSNPQTAGSETRQLHVRNLSVSSGSSRSGRSSSRLMQNSNKIKKKSRFSKHAKRSANSSSEDSHERNEKERIERELNRLIGPITAGDRL